MEKHQASRPKYITSSTELRGSSLVLVGSLLFLLVSQLSASTVESRDVSESEYITEQFSSDYSADVTADNQFDPAGQTAEILRELFVDNDETKSNTVTERSPNFEGTISHDHFMVMLAHVTSSYDFLRIQFGHWLSDEDISDYLSALLDNVNSARLSIRNPVVDNAGLVERAAQTTWKDLDSLNKALEEPYDHLDRLRRQGNCAEPSRKVFRVSHFYPNEKLIYVPADIALHRCDLHSGCCEDPNFICVLAEKKVIRQRFYTVDVLPPVKETPKRQVRIDPTRLLTNLYFINHTKCECKEAVTALAMAPSASKPAKKDSYTHLKSKCLSCPEPFAPRYSNATCLCDCFDGQSDCLHIKRGRKPLDGAEIKCIQAKECGLPLCNEGEFDVHKAVCPKSHKKSRRPVKKAT